MAELRVTGKTKLLEMMCLLGRYRVHSTASVLISVCEVGTVGKMCDCQPEGLGFNFQPGRGLNFGQPSFPTPSRDRDVKLLV